MRHNKVKKLIKCLRGCKLNDKTALIGFDGFIDNVVHIVKERLDSSNYIREKSLLHYGKRIQNSSGYSSNVEVVSVSKKIGGNGPILSEAMLNFGVDVRYIGALGYPEIDPIYDRLINKMKSVYSLSDPAQTDAIEFFDGKIIRVNLSSFEKLRYEKVIKIVGVENLVNLIEQADLLAFVNWSLLYNSSEIWEGILDNIVPLINTRSKKILFFDLADPKSRVHNDIIYALNIIRNYSKYFNVILGLNLSEALKIVETINGNENVDDNLEALCRTISDYLNIYCVVIHPIKASCCIINDIFYYEDGFYCEEPVLTTGAGDNFNAGFILGLLMELEPDIALLLGMAVSGYYVRNGCSGDFDEILDALIAWS